MDVNWQIWISRIPCVWRSHFYVVALSFQSQSYLKILWFFSNITPLQTNVPPEHSLLFKWIALNTLLIANTITLFIPNIRLTADEYSGTFVQRQPPAEQCHTAVTSHRKGELQISPVHLHSSTVYCHSVTAADGTDRTEHKVQCSSLSLYRQTVYSRHCVVLVLLTEWLLFIMR